MLQAPCLSLKNFNSYGFHSSKIGFLEEELTEPLVSLHQHTQVLMIYLTISIRIPHYLMCKGGTTKTDIVNIPICDVGFSY